MPLPPNKQFMVVISNPLILDLRRLVINEYFTDTPIDRFADKRISNIMEEYFHLCLEADILDNDIYGLVMYDIFTLIGEVIPLMLVKSVECWDNDTIFIHCFPVGVNKCQYPSLSQN